MLEFRTVARYAVFAAFALSVLVAFAAWLVRTRRVSSFGALGRALRGASDPIIRPVERRLVRLGGNPVYAGWWLVVVVAIAGVLLMSLVDWLLQASAETSAALTLGPRAMLELLIRAAYTVVWVALVVRIVGAWFGAFRYARWMRPAYALTDWIVEPIRRLLPPTGMIDWSPLVAWLALYLLRQLLLSVLWR